MTTAKDIMVRKAVTVKEDEPLKSVCKILVMQKLSGVPVVDADEKLVGFISERDIIAAVDSKNFQDKKVSDVMTKKVVSVEENAPVDQISQLFTNKPIRYVPVTKDGRLVGIVSRKEAINRLLGQYY